MKIHLLIASLLILASMTIFLFIGRMRADYAKIRPQVQKEAWSAVVKPSTSEPSKDIPQMGEEKDNDSE